MIPRCKPFSRRDDGLLSQTAVPLRTSPGLPPGLKYVTRTDGERASSQLEGVQGMKVTIEICGHAGSEASGRGDGQGATEIDQAGDGSAMDSLQAVLLASLIRHVLLKELYESVHGGDL